MPLSLSSKIPIPNEREFRKVFNLILKKNGTRINLSSDEYLLLCHDLVSYVLYLVEEDELATCVVKNGITTDAGLYSLSPEQKEMFNQSKFGCNIK